MSCNVVTFAIICPFVVKLLYVIIGAALEMRNFFNGETQSLVSAAPAEPAAPLVA